MASMMSRAASVRVMGSPMRSGFARASTSRVQVTAASSSCQRLRRRTTDPSPAVAPAACTTCSKNGMRRAATRLRLGGRRYSTSRGSGRHSSAQG